MSSVALLYSQYYLDNCHTLISVRLKGALTVGENVIFMICSLLEPITIMITALVIWKLPAEFGGMWAYRTTWAGKSPATWVFAQYSFGKIGFFSNLAALVLTVMAFVPVLAVERFEPFGALVCMIVTTAQVALMFVDIFVVEGLLKKNFDKEGNPKNQA